MYVTERVLAEVNNEAALINQIQESPQLALIVREYNQTLARLSAEGRTLHNLSIATGSTSGERFKQLIQRLPAEDCLRLMNRYLAAVNGDIDVSRESDALKEERKMRMWLIRVMVYSFLVMSLVLIGATVTIGWQKKSMPDNAVVTAVVKTAGEIIKILFTTK